MHQAIPSKTPPFWTVLGDSRDASEVARIVLVGAALGWSVMAARGGQGAPTLLGLAVAADAVVPHRIAGWVSRSLPFLAAAAPVAPISTGIVMVSLAIYRHARAHEDGRPRSFRKVVRWAVLEKVGLVLGTLLASGVLVPGAAQAGVTYVVSAVAMLLLVALWQASRGRFDLYESRLAARDFVRGALPRWGLATVAGGVLAEGAAPSLLALAPVALLLAGIHERDSTRSRDRESMLRGLGGMLRYAHPYTLDHMERVERIADRVGRELKMGPRHRAELARAALLHDVGKVAVDERILEKPGRLEPDERVAVMRHPVYGAEIVAAASPSDPIVPWIRHHHERLDGTGYPAGLAGEAIPVESRIIAVIDAYDAMTGRPEDLHRRAYRDAIPSHEARLELRRHTGTQFDPRVVAAFERVLQDDDHYARRVP